MKKFESSGSANSNMEDIMKINELLKPYQERSNDVSVEDNIFDKCKKIEHKLVDLDDESIGMKEFELNLNKAIELMTSEVFDSFDKSYNEFNPELLTKYKDLKNSIKEQKDENANLLKQIDHLNQEIHQIFENVVKLQSRLDVLERYCGVEKQLSDDEEEEFSEG
jgi:septal ring factor EnvC (AmiA/AmiB activator)